MPRRSTPTNSAKQINNVLQKMKDVTYNANEFMQHYIDNATVQKSPKYSTEIAKCLKDNNCFTRKGNDIVLVTIPPIDILKSAIEKGLKTRKQTLNKIPKLRYSVNNNDLATNSNLIPKHKFLDSISTIEIIDYLLNDRKIIIANNKFYLPL